MQTSLPQASSDARRTASESVNQTRGNRRERLGVGAFLVFVGLYSVAFLFLVVHGNGENAKESLRYAITFGALSAVTYAMTMPATQGYQSGPVPSALQRPLTIQTIAGLGICLLAVALMGVLQTRFDPALLGPSFASAQSLIHFGVVAFVCEVVFVFAALRALGVPARVFGLARWGNGSYRVAIVWIGLAMAFLIGEGVGGHKRVAAVLALIVRNLFQNGFSEEFLFRGALLSRLRAFVRVEWALLGQALLFGLWHYGTDMRAAGGDPWTAIAYAITVQSVFGYALGFLVVRTRSIAISSSFHALADATSII